MVENVMYKILYRLQIVAEERKKKRNLIENFRLPEIDFFSYVDCLIVEIVFVEKNKKNKSFT